jgi:hypothetical protein
MTSTMLLKKGKKNGIVKHGKKDGITIYVPKETILKEMAVKTE